MDPAGFTLLETLLGVGLLIGGVAVLLFGMHFAMIHSEYLSQMQLARNEVQGVLDRLSATPFSELDDVDRFPLYPAIRRCVLGDANCDGDTVDEGEAGNAFRLARELPTGGLLVQIRRQGDLRDLHVAACWSHRGRPIGEDQNCNGVFDDTVDGPEDANGNGWVDSPVMVSTRVGRP